MGPVGMLNGPFVINGSSFDMEIINFEIPLNNTEIWELTNMTAIAHPFHIHDVQFYILDINGNPPPTNMKGRKDVVLVPPMFGTVRFITMFEDFADDETPYMYHCHMLSHEDDGMMGQFIIFDNTTSIDELDEESVSVYPNPTADFIRLSGLNDSTIELYNTSGQLLERRESANGEEEFGLSDYGNGVYYLNVITSISNETFKVILQK
jgi:bilirubin oxidase